MVAEPIPTRSCWSRCNSCGLGKWIDDEIRLIEMESINISGLMRGTTMTEDKSHVKALRYSLYNAATLIIAGAICGALVSGWCRLLAWNHSLIWLKEFLHLFRSCFRWPSVKKGISDQRCPLLHNTHSDLRNKECEQILLFLLSIFRAGGLHSAFGVGYSDWLRLVPHKTEIHPSRNVLAAWNQGGWNAISNGCVNTAVLFFDYGLSDTTVKL